MTTHGANHEPQRVTTGRPDRRYFEAWLRRASRQFSESGRLSQTAELLARENGGTPDEWRVRLRTVLDGGEIPSIELLTRIDALLAGSTKNQTHEDTQGTLFQ